MAVDASGITIPTSAGQDTTTTVGTTNTLPDWYSQYGQSVAGTGLGLLSNLQNYQGYVDASGNPLPLTAGPSTQQQTAYGMADTNVGTWQPGVTAGQGALGQASAALTTPAQGAAGYDPTQMQQFMNPYVSNVVDEMARLNTRNMNENVLPAIDSTFARSGQFGSTRNADILGRTVRDNASDLLGRQYTALYDAQNQANNLYDMWNKTGISGAGALGQIGSAMAGTAGLQQQYGLNDINALLGTGGQQQQTEQANLTNNYNSWLQQQAIPATQLGQISNAISPVISGYRPNSTSQVTNTANPLDPTQAWASILEGLGNPNGTGGAITGGLNAVFGG